MSDPFIGEIKMVGFTFAPYGWAFCNGQTMLIVQNTALYSLLGATYGGNGTTTFNLPNLQGRAPVGIGSGPGLTQRNLGQSGGASTVTLGTLQMPVHNHTAMGVSGSGPASPANNTWGSLPGRTPPPAYQNGNPNVTMSSAALDSTGNNSPVAHNNMQPYLAVNFVIATSGIYPSRG